MSDALDAVADALAKNKRLAASCQVRKQDLEAELARVGADDPRAAALGADIAAADAELQAALKEVDALRRLGTHARGPAIAATDDDPLIRSDEEIALDNARSNIATRAAEAGLGRQSPADRDADAMRRFQELRAKKAGASAETPPPAAEAAAEAEAPKTPPKKTF